MITLDKLAEKARNKDWEITNDEAICIWQFIPEGCIKQQQYMKPDRWELIVKGLGVFEIK